ncbi:unnamed protein product [Choristocarpus tenellus]
MRSRYTERETFGGMHRGIDERKHEHQYSMDPEPKLPSARSNRSLVRRPSTDSTRRLANRGLQDLYDWLGGQSWKCKTGWMDPGSEVRNWHGLTINNNGELESINLISNNLDGEIPDSVCDMISLRELNLSYNFEMRGWIPKAIGALTHLKTLHLYGAGLSGSIPESLGLLENLEELFLHLNYLEGQIPRSLGRLRSLRKLLLNSNNLTGAVPVELSNLNKLDSLNLSWNSLAGEVPSAVLRMGGWRVPLSTSDQET